MSSTEEMYSCEYEFSDEELQQLEEIYAQYDKMLLETSSAEVGFCGFSCNYGCPACSTGYDPLDE